MTLHKTAVSLLPFRTGICVILLCGAGFIGFLILMALADGKCTKAMNGKPFDGTRTYSTDYSVDDCIGLLSRKNMYDVLRYSFRQDKYKYSDGSPKMIEYRMDPETPGVIYWKYIEEKKTPVICRC